MKRIRLAALAAALFPGLVAGCASWGNGPFLSRWHGNRDCPCEAGVGPCCDGAMPGEGMVAGPALPSVGIPATVPPLAPAPRLIDPAQPAPAPASPSSRTK